MYQKHYIIRAENNGISWLVIHQDGFISKEFTQAGKAHLPPVDTTDTLTRDDIDSVIGDLESEHKHRIRRLREKSEFLKYSLFVLLLFFSSMVSAQTSHFVKSDTIPPPKAVEPIQQKTELFTGKYYAPEGHKYEIWIDTTGAFFFTLPNGKKLYIK